MARFRMTAEAGDTLCAVLFDPTVLGTRPTGFESEIELGRVLAFSMDPNDDTIRFDLFVEEKPPIDFTRRAVSEQRGMLSIAGGRLVACNALDLDHLDRLRVRPPASSEITLRPGTYRVDAFQVAWDRDREALVAILLANRERTGSLLLRWTERSMFLAAIATLLVGMRALALSEFVSTAVLTVVLVWVGLIAVALLPPVKRAYRERDRIRDELPDFVLTLVVTNEPLGSGFRCGTGTMC